MACSVWVTSLRGEPEIIGAVKFVGQNSGNMGIPWFGRQRDLGGRRDQRRWRPFRSWSAQRKEGRLAYQNRGIKRSGKTTTTTTTTSRWCCWVVFSGRAIHHPWTMDHEPPSARRCLFLSWQHSSSKLSTYLVGQQLGQGVEVVRNGCHGHGKGRYKGLCSGTNRAVPKRLALWRTTKSVNEG